jgi:uncharacterized iron-regulated membrane protein
MKPRLSRPHRQKLLSGHAGIGIVLSYFLYFSIFFGLFAIFLPFLQTWEKPSRHFALADITAIRYEPMLAKVLSDPDIPKDRIFINVPGYKGDPALIIHHMFSKKYLFDPNTCKQIKDEGKASSLAWFLNGMHYGRPLMKPGILVFGFVSTGVLFLVAGGLVLVWGVTYKSTGKTKRGRYSRLHRKIFTWTFPVFVLILICATVMGVSFDAMGPMTRVATKGEHNTIRPVIGPVLFPEEKAEPTVGEAVPMPPISRLVKKGQDAAPHLNIQRLVLYNWGDKTARIQLEGTDRAAPFLTGITNKPYIILNAVDGRVLKKVTTTDRPWPVLLTEGIYCIHLLFGVNIYLRLFIFMVAFACLVAVGCGVMVHLEKQTKKFKPPAPFYHWLEKFSLAFMIGVIPATGLLFTLQWLLPFDLKDRTVWQQGLFFDLWAATLFWSFYRIDTHGTAKQFIGLGGVLFMLAPVLHFLKTGISPSVLLQNHMPHIFWVDAGLMCLGLSLTATVVKGKNNNA